MYHIEVLPSSTSRSAPGYTYIPTTSHADPSKAPLLPSSTTRKRARLSTADNPNNPYKTSNPTTSTSNSNLNQDGIAATGGSSNAVSARQASKIAKHIADLDRENHKDVAAIVVPGKSKDVAMRGLSHEKGRVMTTGVRRILGSQKGWGNWLADEEAALALRSSSSTTTTTAGAGGSGGIGGGLERKGGEKEKGAKDAPMTAAERKRVRDRESKAAKRRRASGLRGVENVAAEVEEEEEGKASEVAVDVEASTADTEIMDIDTKSADADNAPPQAQPQSTTQQARPPQPDPNLHPSSTSPPQHHPPTLSNTTDPPLLPPPTPSQIALLLSHAPLSYAASRAAPSTSTAPPRKFCEMCGYWGRVVCMKCGVRVCGIECREAHDESRCLKFYA